MSNSYMWAQTACDIPETPSDRKYSESKPQSAQMPRSYQSESHNGHDTQSSYSQASGSPPSYGAQSRSSSYTHSQQQPSHHQEQQSSYQQQQPSRQSSYNNGSSHQDQQHSYRQEQPTRQSSYTNGGSNGHHGGSSDFIEQSVSMQDLTRENFGGQGSSSGSLQLSPALLEHLQHVPQRGESKLYYLEPQNGGKSMSGMMYPSSDLALVNQLAVKHHRHACMKILDGSGPEQNEKVLRGTEWSLLNEERIELTTQLTVGGGQRVTVNTTVQELSLFHRK